MTAVAQTDLTGVELAPVVLTEAALERARAMILEQQNPELKLRVYIEGGGCSGFQYGFSFEESAGPDDIVFERDGVSLLVDSASAARLAGARIDYQEDLYGRQFVIHNPNATTCSCGD